MNAVQLNMLIGGFPPLRLCLLPKKWTGPLHLFPYQGTQSSKCQVRSLAHRVPLYVLHESHPFSANHCRSDNNPGLSPRITDTCESLV